MIIPALFITFSKQIFKLGIRQKIVTNNLLLFIIFYIFKIRFIHLQDYIQGLFNINMLFTDVLLVFNLSNSLWDDLYEKLYIVVYLSVPAQFIVMYGYCKQHIFQNNTDISDLLKSRTPFIKVWREIEVIISTIIAIVL